MVKTEDMFFVPGKSATLHSPPGFPPQPPRDCGFTAAADIPGNPDTAFLVYSINGTYRKKSVRKRSRPQFYKPPATRPQASVVVSSRRGRPPKDGLKSELVPSRRGRPPKGGLMSELVPSRRGRPPKAGLKSELSSKETKTRTPNAVRIDPKILPNAFDEMPEWTSCQATVNDSKVDFALVLEAINKRHGYIAQDCVLESDSMRNLVLLGVCKVVLDLEKKQLKDVDLGDLDSYYATVRDAENMKVNIRWLRERLDEIRDAVKSTDEEKAFLVNEKNKHLVNIDMKKKELKLLKGELERLRSEVEDLEDRVAREVLMVEELDQKIGAHQSRFLKFQHGYLMDGLI